MFSSFIGLVVGFVSSLGMSILPFLVAIGVFLFILLKWKPPSWFWITALATILIGAPATFSKSMSGIEANNESHDLVIQSIMLFLLGFGTTLVTESLALEVYFKDVAISWFLTKLNFWRVILVANIVSYIILIPFLILSPPLRFQFNP
ncbi:MAG: hypothetical protein NTY09_00415 [bacterium]|nr:hypothetical protein [bacterium]